MAISAAPCDQKRIHGVGKAGVVCAFGALLLGYSGSAATQTLNSGGIGLVLPWTLRTGVSTSATYSDNINLAPPGQERSDLVITASPFLQVDRSGPRLRLHLVYSPDLVYYTQGTNGSAIRNTLSSLATAVIVPDRVFFDASAQISQQSVSPFGVAAPSAANGSNNRAEARTLTLSPYVRSRFGRDGTYQFGYRYTKGGYNNNLLSNNDTNDLYGSVSGGTTLRYLGWGLDYDRSERGYSQYSNEVTEQASGTLRYLVDPRLTVSVTGGEDRDSYPTFAGQGSQGKFYSAGFNWAPSPTTSLRAQHGHRYFGRTDVLQLTHRTRMTVWSLAYNRDRTSSLEQLSAPATSTNVALLDTFYLSRYPDPIARGQAIDTLLQQSILPNGLLSRFNFLTNQFYLQKRLDASLLLMGRRNSVILAISRSDQTALSDVNVPADVFATTRSFKNNTISATWTHQLSQRSTVNLLAQRLRAETLNAGSLRSTQRLFSAEFQHQLQRNLTVAVTVRTNRGQTDVSKYTENAIVGSARLQF